MQHVSFVPHKSFGGQYIETETFAEMKNHLRAHVPASSTYRAIAGSDKYTVLYMSDYIQGPTIAGYLRISS